MPNNPNESPNKKTKKTDFKAFTTEPPYSVYKNGVIFASAEPYGSLIGRGKFSKVYKGVLHGGGRTVTIKVHNRAILRPTRTQLSYFSQVQKKVEWLRDLHHPRVAEFIDWIPDFQNNRSYIIMQYVEGRGLNQELADKGPFSQARVLNWACQLLDAMEYLHGERYVIGDLDPSSVVLTPKDDVCLVDFKYLDDIRDTFREDVKYYGKYGTSPEEEEAFKAGVREDIRRLGATMFELLTGQSADNLGEKTRKAALSEKGVSASVRDVIFKALSSDAGDEEEEKDGKEGYSEASKMAADLRALPTKDRQSIFQVVSLALTAVFTIALFLIGWFAFSTGQYQVARYAQMQTKADDSSDALRAGAYTEALSYALEATAQEGNDPPCPPEAQAALADAVSAYDYVAGYKPYRSDFNLRGVPVNARFSPDGNRVAVLVEANVSPQAKRIRIFDAQSAKEIDSLPVSYSPSSAFAFLDDDRILYAGESAVKCYSLSGKRELWSGPAGSSDGRTPVSVAVSADGKKAASVRWDSPYVYVYDTENAPNGTRRFSLDRPGKEAEPTDFETASLSSRDNLFALSYDGRYLAVSFSDGGAGIYDLTAAKPEEGYRELIDDSPYLHFEGGFYRGRSTEEGQPPYEDWFFYSAANTNQLSVKIPITAQGALVRLSDMEAPLELERNVPIHMQADQNGIYLSVGDWLYHANTEEPESVYWEYLTQADDTIRLLRHAAGRILAVTEDELVLVYREDGAWKVEIARGPFSIADLSERYVLLAASNKAPLSLLRYIEQDERGTEILSYNAEDETSERSYYAPLGAHVSTDGKTAMLFRSTGLRVYDLASGRRVDKASGEDEVSFGREAERLIYQRKPILKDDPKLECLKVIYENDVEFYSANGDKLPAFSRTRRYEDKDASDADDDAVFPTSSYRVKQNGGGPVRIYDAANPDKLLRQRRENELTYASQAGEYLLLSFMDGKEFYSLLLDKNLDVIAKLPEPCEALPSDALLPLETETGGGGTATESESDGAVLPAETEAKAFPAEADVVDAALIFNDMQGHLLKGSLYTPDGLRAIANWRNKTE